MKPRFSLRTLLWLTLVVAVAFGWWADGRRLSRAVSPALRIHVKDSIELSPSWNLRAVSISNEQVCNLRFASAKRLQLIGVAPGTAIVAFWAKCNRKPTEILVEVHP